MLPLQARMDQDVMAMKGYSAFPKAPALLKPHHQIVYVISRTLIWWESYLSAEMQSVYSTVPADWATKGISLRVNVTMWLGSEHAYSDVAVQQVSHYIMVTSPPINSIVNKKFWWGLSISKVPKLINLFCLQMIWTHIFLLLVQKQNLLVSK